MTTQATGGLAVALEVTGQLVDGVQSGQWAAPTPCTEWAVRDLVGHLIAGNVIFASALSGQPPAQPPGTQVPDDQLAGAYRAAADALLGVFGEPGALDRMVTVPFGTVPGAVALHLRVTEILVHGWDLGRATGQPAAFPEELARQELAFSQAKLADMPAGRTPFAPPRPVSGDAPAIDQLAACLGRDIS